MASPSGSISIASRSARAGAARPNYAKAGRFEEAIRSAEHALQLARVAGKNDLAERIQARLLRDRARTASGR